MIFFIIRWTCLNRKKSDCKNRSVQESYLKRSIKQALGWSTFELIDLIKDLLRF